MIIYCVEDDEDIRELVVYALKSSGFEADGFDCASGFEAAVNKRMPDMVILDIMLPDKSGIEILTEIRENKQTSELPVILLTAKNSETDKVKGFDCGADDYITKPFGVLELVSRVKAVLKRCKRENGEIINYNGIVLDATGRSVMSDGMDVELTYKEFELLYILLKNIDKSVSRDKLLADVWGYDFEGESRTLDVHIGSLRHKLGENGKLIKTVRNVGYKIS